MQGSAVVDQFVAGGDHAHLRSPNTLDLLHTHTRKHAEMAGGEHGAGSEEQVAGLDILTGTTHMVALRDGQVDEHRAGRFVEGGLLDHDHGVGTVGHRAPVMMRAA